MVDKFEVGKKYTEDNLVLYECRFIDDDGMAVLRSVVTGIVFNAYKRHYDSFWEVFEAEAWAVVDQEGIMRGLWPKKSNAYKHCKTCKKLKYKVIHLVGRVGEND